jgi:hypothetical protein
MLEYFFGEHNTTTDEILRLRVPDSIKQLQVEIKFAKNATNSRAGCQ